MNFCSSCGAKRSADANFCVQCGTAFAAQAQTIPSWPELEEAQTELDDWVATYRPVEFRDYSHGSTSDEIPDGWDPENTWTQVWNWDSDSEYLMSGFYATEDARGHFLTANPLKPGDEESIWFTYMERPCPLCVVEEGDELVVTRSPEECGIHTESNGNQVGELRFDYDFK
jgi:hypothetical protein